MDRGEEGGLAGVSGLREGVKPSTVGQEKGIGFRKKKRNV